MDIIHKIREILILTDNSIISMLKVLSVIITLGLCRRMFFGEFHFSN